MLESPSTAAAREKGAFGLTLANTIPASSMLTMRAALRTVRFVPIAAPCFPSFAASDTSA